MTAVSGAIYIAFVTAIDSFDLVSVAELLIHNSLLLTFNKKIKINRT